MVAPGGQPARKGSKSIMNVKKSGALGVFLCAGLAFGGTAFKVNGKEVSTTQLQLAKQALLSRMGLQPGMVDETMLTKAAVDQLVGMELLAQAAAEAQLAVDPSEVKASLEQEKKEMGGEQAFAQALAGAGLTEAELDRMEEQRLLVQKFIAKEIAPKAAVSDADLEAYYSAHPDEFEHEEQLKLQMILTRPAGSDEKAQAEAKAKAEAAAKRVASGEDFAKVAKEVSQDASAQRGGEVGWVRKGMLLAELEAPVFALKAGEVSQVLKSQYGYHVFRVAERRPAGQYPLAEVKDNLRQMLSQRKTMELLREAVDSRKAKAKIEAVDPQVKAALEAPAPQAQKDSGKQ
jgi:parvulin-like peptidyl-prolyl isomerase